MVKKLFKILLEIHNYLFSQRKQKYIFFLILGLFSVILESFGYLSIVPLITVLINPGYLETSFILSEIKQIIQSDTDYDFIMKYGLICISLFIFGSIFSFIQISLQVKFVNSIILNTRNKLLENYLNKNLSFHKNNNSTHLISKLFTQIDEMGQTVIFGFFDFINSIFLVLIFLGILSLADWKLTISALCFLVIFYFLIELNLKKKVKSIASILYESNLKALSYASETIKLFKEISLELQKNFFLNRFDSEIKKIYKARNFVRIIPRLSKFLIETVGIGSIIILILYVYSKEKNVNLFLETIILFSLSVYKIFPNLNKCFQININLKSGSKQLFNILNDFKNDQSIKKDRIKDFFFKNTIKFENISFFYKDKKIINEINLNIKKNSTILIYGKSGSGKSTICDLISGHLKPSNGSIIVDGIKRELHLIRNLKKYVGYVGQEPLILNENFYKNISLEDSYEKNKIEDIGKIARLDEFITNKKNKYDEIISENGKNLSGGQKQRISIARALYLDPEILIIDEGTSNIDTVTEKEIYELIYKNFKLKTKIIITHHLNEFIKYDYCYKIEHGKIIHHGEKAI